MMPMKLAISTEVNLPWKAVYPLTRKQAIMKLVEGGAKYLDYALCEEFQQDESRKDTPFLRDDWREYVIDLRKAVEEKGAAFVETHCVFCNFFDYGNEFDQWLVSKMEQCYEATALLGASVTVVHPIAPPGKEYDREASLIANRDFFRNQADIAAKYGVKLAVENMLSNRLTDGTIYKRCCTTTEELVELVKAIDHPNVGICVDIGHVHYMKEDIYSAVINCREHLIALHVHDNDTWNDNHMPPYTCTLDWEAFYRALNDIGYRGVGMVELLHGCWKLPEAMQEKAIRYFCSLTNYMMSRVTEGGSADEACD